MRGRDEGGRDDQGTKGLEDQGTRGPKKEKKTQKKKKKNPKINTSPPKTIMEPKNVRFEDDFLSKRAIFRFHVNFMGGNSTFNPRHPAGNRFDQNIFDSRWRSVAESSFNCMFPSIGDHCFRKHLYNIL